MRTCLNMKKRLTYIDVINIVAIYAVLMLHSSQYWTPQTGTISNGIIQSIFIPAVYLFFMNSGAMLINYLDKYDTKTFFFKRFKRVVIPLIVWSIIWYLIDTRGYIFPAGPVAHTHPSIYDFIISFVNNNIFNIFWFFYAIILLYVTTPILAYIAKKNVNILFYIVCLSFVSNFLITYVLSLMNQAQVFSNAAIQTNPCTSTFIGFYIMGYLIKSNYFNSKQLNIFKTLGLISICILIISDILNFSKNIGNTPYLFFYSIGVFICLKQLVEKTNWFTKHNVIIAKLSSTSLAIYIVHPLFFKIITEAFHISDPSIVHTWLVPLITYVVCALLFIIIKKFKLINTILP